MTSFIEVNPATEGLDDFVDKHNEIVVFLNGIGLGDEYVPSGDGTVSLPAFSFPSDTDTGWYLPASGQVALAIGGVQEWLITSTLFTVNMSIDVNGNADISGTLDVDGAGTFNSGLEITSGGLDVTGSSVLNGSLTITSGGVDVTGNSDIDGTLGVTGKVTVTSGGIDVTGDSDITGGLDVTGALTSGSFVSDTSIDFSTTFAGINKERVVNSFSRVRSFFLGSL